MGSFGWISRKSYRLSKQAPELIKKRWRILLIISYGVFLTGITIITVTFPNVPSTGLTGSVLALFAILTFALSVRTIGKKKVKLADGYDYGFFDDLGK
jgi:polyferredoxin